MKKVAWNGFELYSEGLEDACLPCFVLRCLCLPVLKFWRLELSCIFYTSKPCADPVNIAKNANNVSVTVKGLHGVPFCVVELGDHPVAGTFYFLKRQIFCTKQVSDVSVSVCLSVYLLNCT